MLEETQDTEEIIERVATLAIGKAEVVCAAPGCPVKGPRGGACRRS
ncbi:hypothetical protein ACWGQ5_56815 [Streptomyces sp. NPDC055722]